MVLFGFQFSPVCNFGKFDYFGFESVSLRSERDKLYSLHYQYRALCHEAFALIK